MATVTLQPADPVIQVTFQYPDNITFPQKIGDVLQYQARVTIKNTSNLPIASSSINVTLDNDLSGYDAKLLLNGALTNLLPLDFGPLAPGGSSSEQVNFRTYQVWEAPPPKQNGSILFHVMPTYEIKHSVSNGAISEQDITIYNSHGGGGGVSWTTNPPGWAQEIKDPNIAVTQGFFGGLKAPLEGLTSGWVGTTVTFTNKSPVAITFLKFQVEVDDDLANYDLYCSKDTQSWVDYFSSDDQGRIEAGATVNFTYWERPLHIDGAQEAAESGKGKLHLAPWYKVEYERSTSLNQKINVTTP